MIHIQKTYKFKRADGSEIIKTLAIPIMARITDLMKTIGKKSFADLLLPENQIDFGVFVLDIILSRDKLIQVLNISLEEGFDGIDLEIQDTRIFDEVIQDFFEQRATTMRERFRETMKSQKDLLN